MGNKWSKCVDEIMIESDIVQGFSDLDLAEKHGVDIIEILAIEANVDPEELRRLI